MMRARLAGLSGIPFAFCLVSAIGVLAAAAQPVGPRVTADGAALFQSHCASCHAGTDSRTPTVEALRQRTRDEIVGALSVGVMRAQASRLDQRERVAIADYLGSANTIAPADRATISDGRCTAPTSFGVDSGPSWGGWSVDVTNTRSQSAQGASLPVDQISRLKLKWAFGFPNATSARAAPTLFGGRLFVGSQDGTVYALDARTGCRYWSFKAKASVRTPIVIDGVTAKNATYAYFGDGRSNVYAVDANTGLLLWTRAVEDHPSSHVTGGMAVDQGRIYVAVASGEEAQGNNPTYACCTFRGSVVALNASTGALIWKAYTIEPEPGPLGKNRGGSERFGPSGAGIWASPTIDRKRRLLYAATGNMYTEPQQKTSDAVIAFDLDTGKIVWVSQVTPRDVFVVGCNQPNPANCPVGDDLGPDFDFGNAPMLVTAGARDLIVIGQKSGVGYALDPDKQGAILWQYRAGKGSALGGMEFGSAADANLAYFPVADGNQPSAGELHAVRLTTGERAWMAPPRPVLCGERARGCTPAILGAITVIPGAVFAGAMDGGLRAYSTQEGSLLWEFNTNREFTTVNGVTAKGASINGPGPIVAGGMVFVNSGYGALGGRPGNVLLAFALE